MSRPFKGFSYEKAANAAVDIIKENRIDSAVFIGQSMGGYMTHAYENMSKMLSVYDKNELCYLMAIGYAGFMEDNCDLKIDCPTLLIVGDCDKTGKVQQYNIEWSKDINAPITWIKDAAHNSNDDQPEQVNKCIKDFLLSIDD